MSVESMLCAYPTDKSPIRFLQTTREAPLVEFAAKKQRYPSNLIS